MSKLSTQTVIDVRHWNDSLFSFKVTRDAGCASRTASS
jgi:ferredoxin--NADP+ reductase